MKPTPDRGYMTQCAGYQWRKCQAVIRLKKPDKWRCPDCEKLDGPLPKTKAGASP